VARCSPFCRKLRKKKQKGNERLLSKPLWINSKFYAGNINKIKKRDIRRGEKRAEGEKRRVEGAYRIENHLSVRAQTEFAMRIKFPANPKK